MEIVQMLNVYIALVYPISAYSTLGPENSRSIHNSPVCRCHLANLRIFMCRC